MANDPFPPLLATFVGHLAKLQFAEAEKLLRNRLTSSTSSPDAEGSSTALLGQLVQLVNAESQYFVFSYLASKFSFRKENNLRDTYTQIRSELGRIGAEDGQRELEVCTEFARFAGIRASLVEFYALLPAKEWRAFDSDCFRHLMAKLDMLSPSVPDADDPLSALCKRELQALKLFLDAQQAIQNCDAVSALIVLSALRTLLDAWFRSLDPESAAYSAANSAKSSSALPSFLAAFSSGASSRRRSSSLHRLGLLQFLLQFHALLVAKCSLYFHDTLAGRAPHADVRQAFSAPASFLQLFQQFVRKSNAHTVCLLVNRLGRDGPFRGFGYHYSTPSPPAGNEQKMDEKLEQTRKSSAGTEKFPVYADNRQQSGLSEKYPALLFMPTERRATATNAAGGAQHSPSSSEYATICAFVQEGCSTAGTCTGAVGSLGGAGAGAGSSAERLAESGKIRYLYDKNKDQTFFTACVEANIHLVVTFERRVQERESTVHAFFTDALNGLRGTKLFQQQIRTFGK